jgi:site-specific recombinase XerD
MRIPEPKFLLREPKSENKTLIYLIVRYDNKKFAYYTGEKVLPKYWDFSKQRIKRTNSVVDFSEINYWLDTIEHQILKIFRNNREKDDEICNELLKEELDKELNVRSIQKLKPQTPNLFQFIEQFIEQNKSLKSPGTIKVYQTTLKHLRDFNKLYKYKLDFKKITLDFYNDFLAYFTSVLNHSTNTADKYIKTLIVFLNEATEQGINTNIAFRHKKFKRISVDTDKIYLDEYEIQMLYVLEIKNDKQLEFTRDLFVFGCYTGLLFGDLISIREQNILKTDGNWQLKIITAKTKTLVIIPLNETAKSILLKYNCNFDVPLSNQHGNRLLKYLGRIAGLNDTLQLKKSISGKSILVSYKKYELISWHDARRSFATNSYKAGLPAGQIMQLTAHKSEKVFLDYIRVSKEENASLLSNHEFFK